MFTGDDIRLYTKYVISIIIMCFQQDCDKGRGYICHKKNALLKRLSGTQFPYVNNVALCDRVRQNITERQSHRLFPTFDSPPLFDNLFGVVFMVFWVIEDGQYPRTPHFCHPLDYFDYCRVLSFVIK